MASKVPKKEMPEKRGKEEDLAVIKILRFVGWGLLGILAIEAILWYPLDFDLERLTANTLLYCLTGAGFSFGIAAQMKANISDPKIIKNQFRNWLVAMFFLAILVIAVYSAYMFGGMPINHPY